MEWKIALLIVIVLTANVMAAALTTPVMAGDGESKPAPEPAGHPVPIVPCDGDPVPGGPAPGGED